MGFDNHRTSVLFGAALLYDETSATFDWLFMTFLKCMSNKKPQSIYTDQAPALLKSIPNVFEGVFHGLCSWHMSENAKKNLGSRANGAFFDEFNYLISNVETESDFDYSWDQMMKNCFGGRPTSDFSWLVQTHKNRKHWSSVWVKSHFTAGLKTTQLSESFNAFLRGFLQPDHSLVQFFSHFNIMVQRLREKHAELDFKAANTRSKNYPNSQLMRSVVNKYTPACFAFIHIQYDLSFKYFYEEVTTQCSAFNKVFKVFTIEQLDEPEEVGGANYDDDANNSKDNVENNGSDAMLTFLNHAFLLNYGIMDSVFVSKREQKKQLSKYAVVLLSLEMKRIIELLRSQGIKIDDEELLRMLANEVNEEKSDRLAGNDDIKKKFKKAMDDYLERAQEYL